MTAEEDGLEAICERGGLQGDLGRSRPSRPTPNCWRLIGAGRGGRDRGLLQRVVQLHARRCAAGSSSCALALARWPVSRTLREGGRERRRLSIRTSAHLGGERSHLNGRIVSDGTAGASGALPSAIAADGGSRSAMATGGNARRVSARMASHGMGVKTRPVSTFSVAHPPCLEQARYPSYILLSFLCPCLGLVVVSHPCLDGDRSCLPHYLQFPRHLFLRAALSFFRLWCP